MSRQRSSSPASPKLFSTGSAPPCGCCHGLVGLAERASKKGDSPDPPAPSVSPEPEAPGWWDRRGANTTLPEDPGVQGVVHRGLGGKATQSLLP